MENDMSRKTILVLVVLTLVISIFSLFTVVGKLNSDADYTYVNTPTSISNVASGEVSLEVPEIFEPDQESGQVVLNIV